MLRKFMRGALYVAFAMVALRTTNSISYNSK